MKAAVREQTIISMLETRGRMSVNDLSAMLNISVSALRKQLAVMEEKGFVIRTYGGVMAVNQVPDESFESKRHKSVAEKMLIASRARTLIPNNATVALGAGTTIYSLCNLLSDMAGGTIYTNSMQASDYLSHCAALDVHICGGIIRSHTGTLIGNEARNFLSNIQVDYAFISCDAIDSSGSVYSDNLAVAISEQAILNCAKNKYILCDSSKLGRSSVGKITNLSECTALITDKGSSAFAERFNLITNVIIV